MSVKDDDDEMYVCPQCGRAMADHEPDDLRHCWEIFQRENPKDARHD